MESPGCFEDLFALRLLILEDWIIFFVPIFLIASYDIPSEDYFIM